MIREGPPLAVHTKEHGIMSKKIVFRLANLSLCLAAAVLALSGVLADEPDKKSKDEDVRELVLSSPPGEANLGVKKPLKLTSVDELAKALPDQKLIDKQVDFTKEQCLLFAWKSSGQDKLSFKVEKGKDGPVVVFTYAAGLTDDLRPHAHLYVIPRNATWRIEDKK
jgi:hypothetical protein